MGERAHTHKYTMRKKENSSIRTLRQSLQRDRGASQALQRAHTLTDTKPKEGKG